MSQIKEIFPKVRGENKKSLKPPPSETITLWNYPNSGVAAWILVSKF